MEKELPTETDKYKGLQQAFDFYVKTEKERNQLFFSIGYKEGYKKAMELTKLNERK